MTTLSKKISVSGRDGLINLSAYLAKSIDTKFFTTPGIFPYINVNGTYDVGKSMVIEAMMKAILDEYDPDDMKRRNAPRSMFIEKWPGHAITEYLFAEGTINGEKVYLGFDRFTYIQRTRNRLARAFYKAVHQHNSAGIKKIFDELPPGAAFGVNGQRKQSKPWITLDIKKDLWEEEYTVHVTVSSKTLQNSKHFQDYWRALHQMVQTNFFTESNLIDHNVIMATLTPYSAVGLNGSFVYMTPGTDPEAEFLIYTYERRIGYNIPDIVIAQAVRQLHEKGDFTRVNNFKSWLEENDGQEFLEQLDNHFDNPDHQNAPFYGDLS